MAARLKIIRIPRTPANVFDKHREVSDLVRNQLRHAHQELHDWWRRVGGIEPDQIQTEQQAAEYIRTVTRILHPEGAHTARMPSAVSKSGVWLDDPAPVRPRSSRRPRRPRGKRR